MNNDMFVGFVNLEASLVGLLITREWNQIPTDATGAPIYRIYGPDGFMFSGSSTLLDEDETNGAYTYEIEATSANGFASGKGYFILHSYTVTGVTYGALHSFQVS